MVHLLRPADHRLDRAGQLPSVRRRGVQALLRLDDPRGRDQLLGARDLGGGLDTPDPPPYRAKLGSHSWLIPPYYWLSVESVGSGRRYFVTPSASTSAASSGSAGSSVTSRAPSDFSKVRRNWSIASFSATIVSSDSSPVSLTAS